LMVSYSIHPFFYWAAARAASVFIIVGHPLGVPLLK
jgi:hypothetical protein